MNIIIFVFFIIPIFIIAIIASILIVRIFSVSVGGDKTISKLDEMFSVIRNDIKHSVEPRFLSVSPEVDDMVQHAIETWKLAGRVSKIKTKLNENEYRGLETSIERLKSYLGKNDIEIIDYTKQKYNEGLNIDVLSIEKDASLDGSIVKETVEPTIMCKGQVVRRAKVIIKVGEKQNVE